MDLKRNIDIGIGSRAAKAGAAKVRQALDSIKRASRRMAASARRDQASMSKGYGSMIKVLGTLGAALVGKGIISSTKDFGQAIADLSAITGATGEDLQFLRDKSKEFGESTTLSASQAAEAFKLIASAKPDLLDNGAALAAVTKEAIALAEATGEDLPTAAATLGAALNQFGAEADEAGRFINVMAAGSKRGAALVGEVAESLKFAGTIASQAGLSFEETNGALQLMSQFAIKGGEAGTQLRMVLLSLQTQADDRFRPSIQGLQGALDNLAEAHLDDSEAAKLFGSRNVAAARILISQRKRVSELTRQITGTTVAYEQQATRVNTLEGDTLALKSAYEGLELTIGAELEGSLRAMTQAATENIRALAKSPLLKAGTRAILDTIHRALQDIKIVFNQLTTAVTQFGGGAAVFEGVWQGAIENVIKWTKFLWEQFIVFGPANLKLGFTLMIAATDRLRIGMQEKIRILTIGMASSFDIFAAKTVAIFAVIRPTVELMFTKMAHVITGTFDAIKVNIAMAVDDIIGAIQQKLFNVARNLASLGLEDTARDFTDMGIALGKMATNGAAALAATEANEAARKAELDLIIASLEAVKQEKEDRIRIARETADALILETLDVAEAQRIASRAAVEGAIAERDATILAIEALRTKRAEIESTPPPGTPPGQPEGGEGLSDPPDEAATAYEKLGEIQKEVVDGMADGITDMALQGKASFADMAASIIKDIIAIYIKSQLLNALSGIFGGFGSAATSAAGPVAAVQVGPPARTGSDFKVGGAGGMDSQLVAFKASPGEHVSVKTPSQMANQPGGQVNIKQTNVIDARGADAERIEAMLPALLEQNRQRTLNDVMMLKNKGLLRI